MAKIDKQCKGIVLIGYLNYIKKKWGIEGMAECERTVKFERKGISDDKWYPADKMENVLKWIYDTKGPDATFQAGFSITSEVGMVSYAARILGIKKVTERGVEETRKNMNYGDMTLEHHEKGCTVKFNNQCDHKSMCLALQGILSGLYKITNTKGTVTETKCGIKNGEHCVYEMKWE